MYPPLQPPHSGVHVSTASVETLILALNSRPKVINLDTDRFSEHLFFLLFFEYDLTADV